MAIDDVDDDVDKMSLDSDEFELELILISWR